MKILEKQKINNLQRIPYLERDVIRSHTARKSLHLAPSKHKVEILFSHVMTLTFPAPFLDKNPNLRILF